jgi:hypothetical protein
MAGIKPRGNDIVENKGIIFHEKINQNYQIQAGGVAQVVENLLCKYKALSSNTSPTKKTNGMLHNRV